MEDEDGTPRLEDAATCRSGRVSRGTDREVGEPVVVEVADRERVAERRWVVEARRVRPQVGDVGAAGRGVGVAHHHPVAPGRPDREVDPTVTVEVTPHVTGAGSRRSRGSRYGEGRRGRREHGEGHGAGGEQGE